MKQQVIRKRLLMEVLATAGGLTILSALLFFISSLHDDYEQDNRALETQVSSLQNEATSLNDKYLRIQKNHVIYEEAKQKQEKEDLSINRELIKKLFLMYGSKFALKNLNLNMSATQEFEEAAYKKNSGKMVYSTVDLNFDALTDEDVYRFIEAIETDFSGAVKFTQVTLSRENKLTKDAILQIAEDGHMRMVGATVKFIWFGIAFEEKDTNPAGGPNVKAP